MARASTRIGIVGNGNATTTPALVVRNAVVDNGAGTVDVPVLLGGPSGTAGTTTVTVDYSTADGTAVAGSDYTATSGTLTFTPGETVENIPVAISGRTGDLPSRNFTVTLSSPTDATIGIGTGTVVIGASGAIPVAMPSISAPPDVIVGSGDGYVDLPVTLSAPGTNTVTAFYQFFNGTAAGGGACADGASFFADQSGTLTFAPGETTKVVRVDILNCQKPCEGMFSFDLSSPQGGTIGRASTDITIGDCSTGPLLSVEKVHLGTFVSQATGTYSLTVTNVGAPTSGTTTVTDTLPTGETFSSGSGDGFSCDASAQAVTCSSSTPIVSGTPAMITLTVNVTASPGTVLANSATVTPATGQGGTSNTDEVTVPSATTVPDAPTGLTANAGDGQVVLDWTAPTNDGGSPITGYDLLRGTAPGEESPTPIATGISGTTSTDTGLTDGTTYYYEVEAVNTNGSSSPSNEASATPTGTTTTVPGAPTGLTANAGDGQVVLNWTAPTSDGGSPITGYDLLRGTAPGEESPTPVATGISGTTSTDTGLSNGTTYYYEVEAVNTNGSSSPSNEASATPTASTTLAQTTVTTTLSGGGQSAPLVIVPFGTAVQDASQLSGPNAAEAIGTVTYVPLELVSSFWETFFLGLPPSFTTWYWVPVTAPDVVTVTAGSVPTSASIVLPPGVYTWLAFYSGDGSNMPAFGPLGSELEIVLSPPACPVGFGWWSVSCFANSGFNDGNVPSWQS